ncbi:MAG: FG-GAP repeat protein [Flavobacteriales bacterium]|nr:FG-GAP repeat protein [Flavobacteriales bacterium]
MVASVDSRGFSISGPIQSPEWHTRFDVKGIRRGAVGCGPAQYAEATMRSDTVEWRSGDDVAQYVVNGEGLRQNFILQDRPLGQGNVSVDLAVTSTLCAELEGSTGCIFRSADGRMRLAYRDLRAWDACGATLGAQMHWNALTAVLSIVVDDEGATYPITIDPVSTTADRILTPPAGGQFGFSTANAGDLNGDGYSDVVVGAYTASSGEAGEGLAYVYYGSATGIPATPSVTLQVNQAAANFGHSVDGAGDVNGDGFSDLIIGANVWESSPAEDKEGAAFIFHGSAAGINTIPAQILQPNGVNKYMGYSVAGLGDINGDGYSDVGTGGHLANYPSDTGNEGIAWIFLGSATGINPVYRHRLDRDQGAAQFGSAIAPAGDVNGDGYNDVVIGAFKYDLACSGCDNGAVFIYHGSANALGAGANPAPTTMFNTSGYSLRTGAAVSTAGDVNADGYSDIIIGDWRDSIGTGYYEGTAFIYHGSATGINTVPATILQSNFHYAYFGQSVSTAGDVNGDGYADVIVGSIWYENGQLHEGAAFLYLGSSTGIPSSAFARFEHNVVNGEMGASVSTAGDVNGDGYSDMIAGIPVQNAVHIYHGGPSPMNNTPSYVRDGAAANSALGRAVANAGDVNGDGYSDALLAAPTASSGQANEGVVHVHHGSISGLSPFPASTLQADIANAAFGTSVASAGDVDGDGYSEVIVGAPLSGGTGVAYLYAGGPGGLSAVPNLTLSGTAGSQFGASVFKAGDVNADGYGDVIIGAPGIETAYIYWGSPSGLEATPSTTLFAPFPGGAFGSAVGTAGDVNGDGFSDVVIGAPDLTHGHNFEGAIYIYHGDLFTIGPNPVFTFESNSNDRRLGSSVAGLGDVNGDGFYEVGAGAPTTSAPEVNEGAVYMLFGTAAGTTSVGHLVLGANLAAAELGTSIAEAGDVNGDGYADFIGGAPGSTNGQTNEGRAWVFLGSPAGVGSSLTLEPNIASERFGTGVAGGGDVDGDGYSDVICGSPNASPSVANEGRVRLYRGNNALSVNRLTRQYQTDLVSPLATNSADWTDEFFFGIGHRARSPIQRTTAKLRWEVVHEGQPFSGVPITNSVGYLANSATWSDLGLAGLELKELVAKAPSYFRHKWRVRVEYPVHKMIDGQRFSRWFYGYASAVGDIGVLPVELLEFTGKGTSEGNQLNWATGSEQRSAYFLVERSRDGTAFSPIGTVTASGESSSRRDYAFLDQEAPAGLSYYRLQMVDLDGSEQASSIIAIIRDAEAITIFPVPVEDLIQWTTTEGVISSVIIRDALGRIVVQANATGNAVQGRLVQQLATGTYTILLLDTSGVITARSRFLKR